MRVSAKTFFVLFSLFALTCLTAVPSAFAADGTDAAAGVPGAAARYERVFGAQDFKIGQDALKYEVPENGMFKILSRLANSYVFTRFELPEDVRLHREWTATATVYNSESPAAGVGLWDGSRGHIFHVFPDGAGRLQYFEDNKAAWTSDFKVVNFSYPARITLERDPNGNFVARVNGVVVAVRIFEVDLKKPKLTPITAVSFVTHSTPKRAGAAAYFEKLEVAAWGARDLMEELQAE